MPPGPKLAQALAMVDVTRLSGHDTVVAMQAAHRQCCHERAVMLRAVLETGLREFGSADTVERCAEPGEFAAEETRAALTLSRRAADDTYEFAWDIFCRLAKLGEAMLAGELDEPRARAMASWTADLTAAQAVRVCRDLLPDACSVTVGALTDRIKRAAIAIDPEWAERRYRAGLDERKIVGSMNPDGTADVSGRNLPVDRAKAACDRVDDLARACKRAGDGRKIDHIRADIYVGLLDGAYAAMSDSEIIADMLRHASGPAESDADAPTETGAEASDNDDERRQSTHGDHADEPESGSGQGQDDGDDDPPSPPGPGAGGGAPRGPAPGTSPGGARGSLGDTGSSSARAGSSQNGGRPVRELRMEMRTAAGVDDHPAEIPGWGFITARQARAMLAAMTAGEWRFVICDADGRPIASGITLRRPWPRTRESGQHHAGARSRRRPIVELHIREIELPPDYGSHQAGHQSVLRHDQAVFDEGWKGVVRDIADRYRRGKVDLSDQHAPATEAELHRRFALAGLRRHVEVRDRYCTHPCCRRPASECDQDHATDHANGGVTTDSNLDTCCRHDHRLQHDGGWKVVDPATESAKWVSPLGREHPSRPPPVMFGLPHPDPRHGAEAEAPAAEGASCGGTRPCGCALAECSCMQPSMPVPRQADADAMTVHGVRPEGTAQGTGDAKPDAKASGAKDSAPF